MSDQYTSPPRNSSWRPPPRSHSLSSPSALQARLGQRAPRPLDLTRTGTPEVRIHLQRPDELDLARCSSNASTEKDELEKRAHEPLSPISPKPLELNPPTPPEPIKGTIRLLFSLSPRRDLYFFVLPAICLSAAGGALPVAVSLFLGRAFDNFTAYAQVSDNSPTPAQLAQAASTLRHDQLIVMISLFVVAFLQFTTTSVGLTIWAWYGERVVKDLRRQLYIGIGAKGLDWFDLGMGKARKDGGEDADDEKSDGVEKGESNDPGGEAVGGLTGRFARQTDDVRIAIGQNMGSLVQYFSTFIACFVTAMVISYQLTLVVLAGFPFVIIVTGITERLASPLLAVDRDLTAQSANRIERAVNAIATVKAFNAESVESSVVGPLLKKIESAYNRLSFVWGVRLGFTSFTLLSIFVQGFWFGAYLVQKGKLSPGHVTQVAWAALLATSHLQLCVPLINIVEKGKWGMADLLSLLQTPSTSPPLALESVSPTSPNTPISPRRLRSRASMTRNLRKITPARFSGELCLRNVTFHYPARPHPAPPALDNVTLYIPPRETTYIVGTSGSGKSTVGALLTGLYQTDKGRIEADEQGYEWLDPTWVRSHIAMVSQGASVLFEGSVHDNVAVGAVGGLDGRTLDRVSREEVVAACRGALIHDFIRDLPDGYDTWLSGEKGASLSGGQRQRLALARAWIRDPTVLILDEATSALDVTARLLVHEAIKRWRKNQTTIIITHDLSPISADDFVYVLADGRVVEQGYRADLELVPNGKLCQMSEMQQSAKEKDDVEEEVEEVNVDPMPWVEADRPKSMARLSVNYVLPDTSVLASEGQLFSNNVFSSGQRDSAASMMALQRVAHSASVRRPRKLPRTRLTSGNDQQDVTIAVESTQAVDPAAREVSVWQLIKLLYPYIPNKFIVVVGLTCCSILGATTPFFSLFLSQLLTALVPGSQTNLVKSSLLVLLVALIDGLAQFLRYALLQRAAMGWITRMRSKAFTLIMSQDKSWFDRADSSVVGLVNLLVKDTEDARNLLGMVAGQTLAVVVMLALGLIWALVVGWELTLAGFAVAPLFVVSLVWQSRIVDRYERTNKVLREQTSKKFHQTLSNIRAIRSMSLEGAFMEKFDDINEECYRGHLRASPYAGVCYAVSSAMPRVTEGTMFFIGALLMASGRYTFNRMLTTFSLIAFTVAFGGAMFGYIPSFAKSKRAAVDLLRLLELPTQTEESKGVLKPSIRGHVDFENVDFSYPSRADVQVLRSVGFKVCPSECVGIVGASGSGKSTVVALLQRLYEPTSGNVRLDGIPISSMDVHHLRNQVAVVSQHPALFDMSIADNITYGGEANLESAIAAAKAAQIHDFITTLPNGYRTNLGDNAALISGGQAQRLQIARALVRDRRILILDECTSALSALDQSAVMETIASVKCGRTTIMVTHKLDMMRMCDRLLVVEAGRIVEQGTFDDLMSRHGAFASLASQGEWQA